MGVQPSRDRLEEARRALAAAEAAAPAGAPGQVESLVGSGSGAAVPDLPPSAGAGVSDDGEPDPYAVARQIALRQLTMGPRTRHQLAAKLRGRGCDEQVAAAVLDRLTEVELIDDEAYARAFVHSRQETKGLARPALVHELRHRGVADHLIDAALEDVDAQTEKEQARALVARRLPQLHGLERDVQTRRLAGFLARKGYAGDVSYEVIREALDAAPEHQRD